MTEITDHLADIRARAATALERAGREDDVMIVAVSKGHSEDAIRAAFAAGQRHFGESYVQEALAKMQRLSDLHIEWHFVGRIQANKTRHIAERFAWVHTVDRAKIAARLAAHRPPHAAPLNVLIQVNQGGERQKAGAGPEAIGALAEAVAGQPRLALRGLMSIPPPSENAERAGAFFEEMREHYERLCAGGLSLDVLSMGMSGDFETAIEKGSNCVRIGTAIFGSRSG